MKTFKVKSSAIRAAKQAGLTPGLYMIIQNQDGSWSYWQDGVKKEEPEIVGKKESSEEATEEEHKTHHGEGTSSKSTVEKPCSRVWDIAAAMHKADPLVKRKDILNACLTAGVAFYTARTQYQEWFRMNGGKK